MKIVGGSVFGIDHKMHDTDLCFEKGVITGTSSGGEFDATGCYVLPGLIDTHIHGTNGVCFYWSDDALTPALDWLTRHGVTGILPTTCSETMEELEHDLAHLTRTGDDRILGVHAEGPFINPEKAGGMRKNRIQAPDCSTLEQMWKASNGKLKIMTLAPEMEGAEQVIKACTKLGIHVSMGHSAATYEQAALGVEWGASRLTHTFNAMNGFNHRNPGLLGLGLDDERVKCELICDLHHVAAPAIRVVLRAKGAQGVTMVSDGSMFCGMGDGEYDVGDRKVYVKNGLCTLKDGTISASSKCLSDGARNLFRMGVKPEDIAVMAAVNPAKACGCTDRGELEVGRRADVVVFDQTFDVKAVFLKGERVV